MLVSVIIPTANRPQLLAQLLEALQRQRFDHQFEIIVVDDCLETDLNHLSFETAYAKCTVMRGEGKGPARARNLGVSCAIGDYLVFLDDDSVVDPSYLERVVEHLERRPNCALGGPQRSIDRENSFALASEWLADRFVDGERLDEHRFGFTPTNGIALRRSDFQLSGGFNPHFPLAASEDDEFCARWVAAGHHIDVLQELEIQHHFPATLASFVSQQWRYGRGAWHLQLNVPPHKRPRVRHISFYIGLLSGPFRSYGLLRAVPMATLTALSQFIVWAGYMRGRVTAEPGNAQAPARAAKESAK